MDITPRQNAVLAFVCDFRAEHGYSPSLREIAAHLVVTLNAANGHVHALEAKGLIDRDEGVARSIRLAPRVYA